MNREIKFRGKYKKGDDFYYGSLIADSNQPYIVNEVIEANEEYISLMEWCPVIVDSAGQYTGLKDKNGKEIYEGDLHKIESDGNVSYLPIVFDNGAFWLDISYNKDGSYLSLLCEYEDPIHIVGNIYDNPELLAINLEVKDIEDIK